MTPISEMGTSQLRQEIVRLSAWNTDLLAALEKAEMDLDLALERIRAVIALAKEDDNG